MSDYSISTPYSLDQLDLATPDGTEDAAKLDDAIRQIKSIIYNIILAEHNADGTHKGVGASLDINSVTGDKITQHATDDAQRAIGTNHLKDASVTAAKLAAGAIVNSLIGVGSVDDNKYADNSIATVKIKDGAITTAKVLDANITTNKLADGAVTGTKIALLGISAGQIKDNEIGPDKLKLTQNYIIVGGETKAVACLVGGNVTMEIDEATIPAIARFQVNVNPVAGTASNPGPASVFPIALLEESGAPGQTANGGIASNLTWVTRPGPQATTSWTIKYDSGSLFSLNGSTIRFRKTGTYLIRGYTSAYLIGGVKARLAKLDDLSTVSLATSGKAGTLGDAGTWLFFDDVIFVPGDNTDYVVQIMCSQTSGLATGMGTGSLLGGERGILSVLEIIKIG